jgi:hypothetical protein
VLLPRFSSSKQRIEDEEKLAAILLEAGAAPDGNRRRPLRRSADGHDPRRLRGLPGIGRNVSGAVSGSDPVRALLAKERQRARAR